MKKNYELLKKGLLTTQKELQTSQKEIQTTICKVFNFELFVTSDFTECDRFFNRIRAPNFKRQTLARCHYSTVILVRLVSRLEQCFSTFVRPRPGKFFSHKTRARSQQIYS